MNRTNSYNNHKTAFGIYGNKVYHFGAGYRSRPVFRSDLPGDGSDLSNDRKLEVMETNQDLLMNERERIRSRPTDWWEVYM